MDITKDNLIQHYRRVRKTAEDIEAVALAEGGSELAKLASSLAQLQAEREDTLAGGEIEIVTVD